MTAQLLYPASLVCGPSRKLSSHLSMCLSHVSCIYIFLFSWVQWRGVCCFCFCPPANLTLTAVLRALFYITCLSVLLTLPGTNDHRPENCLLL
uniref:Uncharacterized protein n=1 Tax=Labrus bergylta TaxID=56723 RepID=A0A3Q3F3E1_9LABR